MREGNQPEPSGRALGVAGRLKSTGIKPLGRWVMVWRGPPPGASPASPGGALLVCGDSCPRPTGGRGTPHPPDLGCPTQPGGPSVPGAHLGCRGLASSSRCAERGPLLLRPSRGRWGLRQEQGVAWPGETSLCALLFPLPAIHCSEPGEILWKPQGPNPVWGCSLGYH